MLSKLPDLPKVLCLCPTYGRPALLQNSAACFKAQDYPGQKHLLIYDDLGQWNDQTQGWSSNGEISSLDIHSFPDRFSSMPYKYMAMMTPERLNFYDVICMWDDDDIYLPNHISTHVVALQSSGAAWSHPDSVYCDYTPTTIEKVGGNMWASLAFRPDYFRKEGPMLDLLHHWYSLEINAFDFSFMHLLGCLSPPVRPERRSFIFRWGSTGVPHLQWFISSPTDKEAYSRMKVHDNRRQDKMIEFIFDPGTRRFQDLYKRGLLPQ